jgi:hypothetical protein
MIGLEPCPFCGGKPRPAKILRGGCKDGEPDAWAHYVVCIHCACQGPWMKTEGNSIKMWNMRKGESKA